MKERITRVEDDGFFEEYPDAPRDLPLFRFCTDGLNGNTEDDYMFDIVQQFNGTNIWNVARRFYSEYSYLHTNFERRLLENRK